ncbi:CHAT domain-containing protein [Dapis sp. BLCC M229]|uniref:CHAT domain-containing protein n=1 Tax=Dapis sp. BLCC M229 TaxID=3400188 RepID=UPI003CE8D37F
MKKILILSSNPRNDLNLNREIKDLQNVIKRAKNRSEFEIDIQLEVQLDELQELLLESEPQIVHFCGHGTGEEGLLLQNQAGYERIVSTEALSNLFKLFEQEIECVVFNACYSEVQANAIVEHINYVVGMNQEIRDDAAIYFATGFYRALGSGKSIEKAYEFGCNAIEIQLTNSQTSRSRKASKPRKLASKQVVTPEHRIPVIKTKSLLTPIREEVISAPQNDAPESFPESELPGELIEALEAEKHYKGYREQARESWDEFGQTSVVRSDLTQQEYRQRKTLLNKVKDFWIKGFLQPSLYGNTAINLDWKTDGDAVLRPFSGIDAVELDESFEELQTTDILQETGLGKTLLILGHPGSGKTITLLQLAEKLVKQTEQDLTKPIPVMFNLSSWGEKQQPLEEWLREELKDKYQVPKTMLMEHFAKKEMN